MVLPVGGALEVSDARLGGCREVYARPLREVAWSVSVGPALYTPYVRFGTILRAHVTTLRHPAIKNPRIPRFPNLPPTPKLVHCANMERFPRNPTP